MRRSRILAPRFALLALLVMALVGAPFVIWGESFVAPLLRSQEDRAGALTLIAVALLAADSVAPIPVTLVIMFLAAKAGIVAGVVGGTLGLTVGVLACFWVGSTAISRLVPFILPEGELQRMRERLHRNPVLSLACWRSVPVLAETSVILAAAVGVPRPRILKATLLPNFIISLIYSIAADDSLATASLAFFATIAVSMGLWFWLKRSP